MELKEGHIMPDAAPLVDQVRFTRLPQWAQAEIRALVREKDELTALVSSLRGEHPNAGSPVVLEPYDEQIPLPERHTIRYHLGERDWVDVAYRSDSRGPHVEVRCDGQLQVLPQVSNVVRVSVVPR